MAVPPVLSDLVWSPRTLPTGADGTGGPPLKFLRDLGQPLTKISRAELTMSRSLRALAIAQKEPVRFDAAGRSVSTGSDRAAPSTAAIAFLLAPEGSALSQWRPNATPRRGAASRERHAQQAAGGTEPELRPIEPVAHARDDKQVSREASGRMLASRPLVVRTGSEVGVDEGGCSPTRARARCACRSSRIRPAASKPATPAIAAKQARRCGYTSGEADWAVTPGNGAAYVLSF